MTDQPTQGYDAFDHNARLPDGVSTHDMAWLERRARAFVRLRLRPPATDAQLPHYLHTLMDTLRTMPHEPLVRVIVALQLARQRSNRVFVLTAEERPGLASHLAWELQREQVWAILVSAHTAETSLCMHPARIEPLLRAGDVVLALHGEPPRYEAIRAVAPTVGALFVTFGPGAPAVDRAARADAAEADLCVLPLPANGSTRLLLAYLLTASLRDLAEGPTRLRKVS